jgi:hypothetical protein
MSRLSKIHFWQWFEKNHKILFDLPNKTEGEVKHWHNEIRIHLKAYHKDFESILEIAAQQAFLTITVDGVRNHFKKVDDFVDKAPIIPGWTFNALLPPRSIDYVVEELSKAYGIDPKEFRFSFYEPKSKRVNVMVFHPLHTPENDLSVFNLALRTIMNLLGERSLGNNIHKIDVGHPSIGEPDKLEDLKVLPAIFDHGFVVDGKGGLVGLLRDKK